MPVDQNQAACGPGQSPPPNQPAPCPPGGATPAPQPNDPGCGSCKEPPAATPAPKPADPAPCPKVCNCPPVPDETSDCIETLIAAQTSAIAEAERAATFKADLIALQDKAKGAQAGYTLDKYNELLARWKEQDAEIVKLIARLVCTVPCWQCQLECQVCALFNKVRDLRLRLEGSGKAYADVDSLYDLQYWLQRDLRRKEQVFERIRKVLEAWEKPLANITKVMDDNAAIIASGAQMGATDIPKLLYQVFMRLVPMHLAIAPPASVAKTAIDAKYASLCACGKGDPDDCCGPDVGPRTVHRQLLGPQPYLVRPDQYFGIVCCLVKWRYRPAKDALAKAEGELKSVDADIARIKGEIGARLDSVADDAVTELGKPFDSKYCAPIVPAGGNQPPCDDKPPPSCDEAAKAANPALPL